MLPRWISRNECEWWKNRAHINRQLHSVARFSFSYFLRIMKFSIYELFEEHSCKRLIVIQYYSDYLLNSKYVTKAKRKKIYSMLLMLKVKNNSAERAGCGVLLLLSITHYTLWNYIVFFFSPYRTYLFPLNRRCHSHCKSNLYDVQLPPIKRYTNEISLYRCVCNIYLNGAVLWR